MVVRQPVQPQARGQQRILFRKVGSEWCSGQANSPLPLSSNRRAVGFLERQRS
jgi:hypothetical protein